MNRNQKKQFVEDLKNEFSGSSSVILVHYHGLNVNEISDLRKKLRTQGVIFKVAKNKLTKLAVKDTNFGDLTNMLTGPMAVAYSKDPIAAAKGIVNFANENEKLKIIGGVIDSKIVSLQEVKLLATLPSLDELRAKILGVINAPAGRLVGVLQAAPGAVARVINAYATKK